MDFLGIVYACLWLALAAVVLAGPFFLFIRAPKARIANGPREAAATAKRYWVSWWSGYYADEGCTAPPFQVWISGSRERAASDGRDEISLCAVIDAESEKQIWTAVSCHFPDYEPRFCNEMPDGWQPSNRFPGFEGRTSLEQKREGQNPPSGGSNVKSATGRS